MLPGREIIPTPVIFVIPIGEMENIVNFVENVKNVKIIEIICIQIGLNQCSGME